MKTRFDICVGTSSSICPRLSARAMSNYVTLDDRALNVTYSGDWNKMGTASEYDSTTSAPRNNNSSFGVNFYGTFVT